jgi:type II secretory pathway predicted ATPase ExeA
MFLDYYGLNEQPFGVTPDPRFLYLGSKHREALAALVYGTESNRGFLALIAKPGMGKTSLLFQYLDGLRTKARTAFLFQTDGDSSDLMRYILADLGIDGVGKDIPEMHTILNRVLIEEKRAGRQFVLVIDEAQNLDEKTLESVRLLSNCETPWMKLMQIVLAGQPQLAERLAMPSMSQLRQRISFMIRIDPFTQTEVDAYIDHRLLVAGYNGPPLFTADARLLIAKHSEGIPRNINNICFNALSLGWALKLKSIDGNMIFDILADLDLGSVSRETPVVSHSAKEPKHKISQPHEAIQTDAPFPRWLPRLTVFVAFLLALVWFFVPPKRVERRVSASHIPLPFETSFKTLTSSRDFADSERFPAPDVSSPGPTADALPDTKISGVPQPVQVQSPVRLESTSEDTRSVVVVPAPPPDRITIDNFNKYSRQMFKDIRALFSVPK